MNVFQLPYETRLQNWYSLRCTVETLPTLDKCVEIDKWWQQAPLVNHYLHPDDHAQWPGPWDMLVDNIYCNITRGLGMYYTLALTGANSVDFLLAKDDNDDDVALVVVDDAKYVLNYHPNTVISNSLSDFKIIKRLPIEPLAKKLI